MRRYLVAVSVRVSLDVNHIAMMRNNPSYIAEWIVFVRRCLSKGLSEGVKWRHARAALPLSSPNTSEKCKLARLCLSAKKYYVSRTLDICRAIITSIYVKCFFSQKFRFQRYSTMWFTRRDYRIQETMARLAGVYPRKLQLQFEFKPINPINEPTNALHSAQKRSQS